MADEQGPEAEYFSWEDRHPALSAKRALQTQAYADEYQRGLDLFYAGAPCPPPEQEGAHWGWKHEAKMVSLGLSNDDRPWAKPSGER